MKDRQFEQLEGGVIRRENFYNRKEDTDMMVKL